MPKEKPIEVMGTVIECLPNTRFLVQLDDTGHIIEAHIAGSMRKFQIRVLKGDRVNVEMTTYDTSKGRIRFREK